MNINCLYELIKHNLNDEQKREYDKIISNADNVAEVGLVNE